MTEGGTSSRGPGPPWYLSRCRCSPLPRGHASPLAAPHLARNGVPPPDHPLDRPPHELEHPGQGLAARSRERAPSPTTDARLMLQRPGVLTRWWWCFALLTCGADTPRRTAGRAEPRVWRAVDDHRPTQVSPGKPRGSAGRGMASHAQVTELVRLTGPEGLVEDVGVERVHDTGVRPLAERPCRLRRWFSARCWWCAAGTTAWPGGGRLR